jgi:hypothetical protein
LPADLFGVIGGKGIDDDNIVGYIPYGFQASPDVPFLVEGYYYNGYSGHTGCPG